jgi:hypothetical protein
MNQTSARRSDPRVPRQQVSRATTRFAEMSSKMRQFSAAASLLAMIATGCGETDGLPREAISGVITLDQNPLPSGLISFMPDGPDVATQGAGIVKDGSYSIPRDQGLVPGKYKVSITSGGDASGKPKDFANNAPGMPPAPPKDLIPAIYNSKTTLSATVAAGSKNEIGFELQSASKRK